MDTTVPTSLIILLFLLLLVLLVNLWPRGATRWFLIIVRNVLGLRRHSVVVDGLEIVYLEKGRGPPLFLLHGLGADKDNFLLTGWLLSKGHRVIIPDLPGFGESDRPSQLSYSVDNQVQRLHSFVRSLGIEKFALGGNSMGGFVAGAYAVSHPECVTDLWLLAPAGVKRAEKSDLLKSIDAGESVPILARTVDDMRRMIKFVMSKGLFVPGFILRAMAADQDERYEHHLRVFDELLNGQGLDERIEENPPNVPALIVWGEDDRALHVSGADILHQILPRSEVRLMSETGHVPQIEAPRVSVQDYIQFRNSLLTEGS